MTDYTCSLRVSVNATIFNSAPIRTLKQLIGPNSVLLSYRINSIITPSDELLIDIVYSNLKISPFIIHYIPMKEIKHLIPNSEKYICVINGQTVKLNNPKLNDFHDYLPVRIEHTNINDTDAYDKYYSTCDGETYTLNTSDSHSTPIAYFTKNVLNPLNTLLTPLSLIGGNSYSSFAYTINHDNNTDGDCGDNYPPVLYPKSFKPPEIYSLADTEQYYKQTATTIPALNIIETFQTLKQTDSLPNINEPTSTIAFIMPFDILPLTHDIKGIILIQPKRLVRYILYYPTNSYIISTDELNSIKRFIDYDEINYNNYYYLKNQK